MGAVERERRTYDRTCATVERLEARLQRTSSKRAHRLEAILATAEANLRHATDSLNLAEGRLAQARAEQSRAVEWARADLVRAIEAAKQDYESAKRVYAVAPPAAVQPRVQVGTSAPTQPTDNSGKGSQPSGISDYPWFTSHDPSVVRAVGRSDGRYLASLLVASCGS
ncbi:hypothetical protein IWQ56_002776 [Coemansia nantahalensis]|uniref:Uncharacterized protein n=1 Tax=Coemansia nantahalensis TaxID=2789366 RepID=A0ACC1JSU5_9FUNG|nr:hypothetical protein IWQ57_004207 [Coemansia nantahalensis]KAJ2768859.1 hypothetical protein IWQ56_002776 [Coemansia nantahalensis]